MPTPSQYSSIFFVLQPLWWSTSIQIMAMQRASPVSIGVQQIQWKHTQKYWELDPFNASFPCSKQFARYFTQLVNSIDLLFFILLLFLILWLFVIIKREIIRLISLTHQIHKPTSCNSTSRLVPSNGRPARVSLGPAALALPQSWSTITWNWSTLMCWGINALQGTLYVHVYVGR